MATRSFEFRVSFQRLLVGLLLTVTPISIMGLTSLTQSERSLERTIGGYFKTIAAATAAEVSQYLNDRVVDVAEISLEPVLISAAMAANRSYQGMSDAAIAARIEQVERSWNSAASEALSKAILGSEASRLLRRYRLLDQRFLRITVTDERGATIAGTHKTLDYFQGDEEYWEKIVANGRGAVSVTDILFDEATNAHYIGIGIPIREEESQRVIGTVDALVDVTTLLPLVNRHEIGPTGRILLVKEDGAVISGPHVTLTKTMHSQEFASIKDAAGTLSGRQAGFLVSDLPQTGRTVIGFADTGLRDSFPKLGWVVVVAQDAQQAFAPVRGVSRWLAFMSLLGLAMVAMLTAFYALHRPQRYAEIGELRPGRRPEVTTQSRVFEEEEVQAQAQAEKQPAETVK